jgi:hypothetical protein
MAANKTLHLEALRQFNHDRHCRGAARQVDQARAALLKLLEAPVDLGWWRTQPVLWRYQEAVRLRVEFPNATVSELAAKMCMSKDRYWSILRRALKLADTLPDNQEWVIFK